MFHVLLCYSAFSDGQTNHMEKNLIIKTSLLNIQSTHLNVEKDQKMYFLAKETHHFVADQIKWVVTAVTRYRWLM